MRLSKTLPLVGCSLALGMSLALATSAMADPLGTTYSLITNNFQANTDPSPYDPETDPLGAGADSFTPAIPFGVPTYIPEAGITIDSMVATSPTDYPVPGVLVGGLEFIEIWIDTFSPGASGGSGDGGFLNADGGADSAWIVDGLNWGPGEPPAIAAGAFFVQFDIDGVLVDLTPALGVPILPHPLNGGDAIVLDVTGDPASTVPIIFSPDGLGGTLPALLGAFGVSPLSISSVNSMHIGFEIIHIPEPTSLLLLGGGLATLLVGRRRR